MDATSWANGRGYGRFIRHLLPAMAALAPEDELLCFLDFRSAERFDVDAPNVRRIPVGLTRAPSEAASVEGYRSPMDLFRLTRAVWRAAPDVFFSPTVYTYFPLPPRLPAVVTLHDAIAERFPRLTLPTQRARLFWRLKVRLALWQARLVLTVSDFSARELVQALRIRPSRVRVALEAPAPAFRPSDSPEQAAGAAEAVGVPTGSPWFVYVGGFNPHKRLDLAVRAHAELAREPTQAVPAPHLILVGTTDGDVFYSDQAGIRRLIQELGTGGLVHWPGFVPDERLRHLYSGAIALVLPSACEGFGLPAVEAAACGAAVVATTASPLPELLQGAGFFVDPGDLPGLVRAMQVLLQDAPARLAMAATGRERARVLTWERGARMALETIREAAA